MKLIDLFRQASDPQPLWAGNYKIPWDDPEFSARMLKEHLTQDHDLASRKTKTIEHHINWIQTEILKTQTSHLLDLGCGPGLYSNQLAALGHTCYALDFSPASIEYAQRNNAHRDRCDFLLGDLRTADYGCDYDLAMMIYGEFNAFSPSEAAAILARMHTALKPGGQLLIEAHTFEAIKNVGRAANSWYQSESGLFSERPHLCLMANHWHDDTSAAHTNFVVIDAESSEAATYTNTLQAYTTEDYRALLANAGFSDVELSGAWGETDGPLILLRAIRK
jgi:SAM-dependent methyltransferase